MEKLPLLLNITSRDHDAGGSTDIIDYQKINKHSKVLTSYSTIEFTEIFDMLPEEREFYIFVHACKKDRTYKGIKLLKNLLDTTQYLKNCSFCIYTSEGISTLENDILAQKLLPGIEYKVLLTADCNDEDFELDKIAKLHTKKELRNMSFFYSKLSLPEFIGNDEYYKNSYESNIKKAKKVLDKLKEYKINNLEKWGFVSLGGGNGTELFYELENSGAKAGYLIEYNDKATDILKKVLKKYQTILDSKKIEFSSREADLYDSDKFDSLKESIKSNKTLEGVVISIHAVIHELFTRSKLKESFDLVTFMKRVYDLHEKVILIIREPGKSELWPNKVIVEVDAITHLVFLEKLKKMKFAFFSKSEYNYNEPEINKTSSRYVLQKDLAIETLTKLFYNEPYEEEESVAYCSYKEISEKLNEAGFEIYEIDVFDSDSVYKNFKDFGIKVYDPSNGLPLPFPKCFTYTVAGKGLEI